MLLYFTILFIWVSFCLITTYLEIVLNATIFTIASNDVSNNISSVSWYAFEV